MSKILVVNSGSSSLKYQLLQMPEEKVLISGYIERIGIDGTYDTVKCNGEKTKMELPTVKNHTTAAKQVLENLIKFNAINSYDEIEGVGHRVVQGGKYFADSAIVDGDVLAKVEALCSLAPLHNPCALEGYNAFYAVLPNVKHVFTFDTSFHRTIDDVHASYGIPFELAEKHSIAKYGAHGTSHKYVSSKLAEMEGKTGKYIICHLGSGSSISAVKDGKCINTTMGLTPLGGIIMGTRCGDMDPSVVLELMEKENLNVEQTRTLLNKKSGLLGISGVSSDARDIEDAIAAGNPRAIKAYDMFAARVADYIGQYFVQLGGCDAIAFTAGLGENGPEMREMIVNLIKDALGIELDAELNACRGKQRKITTENSKVNLYIIPTNEELAIAQDVVRLLGL